MRLRAASGLTEGVLRWTPSSHASVQSPASREHFPLYVSCAPVENVLGNSVVQIGSARPDVLRLLIEAQLAEPLGEKKGARLFGSTFKERSALLERIETCLLQHGIALRISPEKLDLRPLAAARHALESNNTQVALAEIPRSIVRMLGVKTFAVRLTALSRPLTERGTSNELDPSAPLFLFSQRSLKKAIGPGCWDSLAAGLSAAGETLAESLAREAQEEAGFGFTERVPTFIAKRLFSQPLPEGFLVEESFEYVVTLPENFAPSAVDGEVAQFKHFSPIATLELIENNQMMPEAAVAAIAILQKIYG